MSDFPNGYLNPTYTCDVKGNSVNVDLFSISKFHEALKKYLKSQGLEYKDGEIVKTQRRVAAEAKEAIFDDENERIRKEIIDYFINDDKYSVMKSPKYKELVALFEKQKDINSKEYVFRPLAGCDINTAAIQAVEQQKLGNKIVLAFNGAYIPVEEKTADDIVNEYYSWLEKQVDVKFPEVPIEHGKYYYCIKDYYSGGNLRAKRGDVVQALRGMSIMILDSMEAGKYFLPVNKIEKQGEKNSNKTEPKSKVGDWITDGKAVFHITSYDIDYGYQLETQRGTSFHLSDEKVENKYHLWTIQDAHDGDLIYVSTSVKSVQAIFHKFDNDIIYFHCYLCGDFTQGGLEPIDDVEMIYPLQKTNYQRFFQKMEEAGYEWDAEKKELKKIEQKPDKCDGCNNIKGCVTCVDGDQWGHYKEVEQKPIKMWHDVSEVPDEMQELLVEWESPDATWHSVAFYDAETKAFRHLKQPINNVTRWAYVSDILTHQVTKISDKVWSEEDEKMFYFCCNYLDAQQCAWLQSIKERLGE